MAQEAYTEEEIQELLLSLGDIHLHWHVDEYPRFTRSKKWFVLSSAIAAALIVYAIATANFLFAVIILMIGVITLVSLFKEPDQVNVAITSTGVLIDDMYYDWRRVKDFSIVYEPPEVNILYIDFLSTWQPMLAIPLGDMDPNIVREILLAYAPEDLDRDEERFSDLIRRLYKI